ncbi:MAG: hypothetical protein QOI47_1330, partial [Actinomycetota bacterium]|nr:hypothetical protein [Actinomycetota bacterium]
MSRRLGRVDVVMCVVIGLAAALASLVATRDGVGIDADSAAYLSAAHSVVHGDGVVVPFSLYTDEYSPRDAATRAGHFPLTHFPPLYPLAVAAVSLPGLGVEDAARVLGALLLALNVALLGAVASRCVPNAAVRAAVLIHAVAGPVAGEALSVHRRTWLFQHGQAMSEGLFTTFVLLTLLATLRYRRTPTRAALALVAASAGAALAVRYSGVALVAVAAIAVAMWSSGSRGARVARGAIVGAA